MVVEVEESSDHPQVGWVVSRQTDHHDTMRGSFPVLIGRGAQDDVLHRS